MKLIAKKDQYRNDFTGIYKCEHCDHEMESYGYDDNNFYVNVIPSMTCPKCGKKGAKP